MVFPQPGWSLRGFKGLTSNYGARSPIRSISELPKNRYRLRLLPFNAAIPQVISARKHALPSTHAVNI
jgi:hypothetical protein